MKDHFFVFDLETTGFSGGPHLLHSHHRIVQIALAGAEGATFTADVNPDCHIPLASSAIHGVDDCRAQDAEPWAEVWTKVCAWIHSLSQARRIYLVAHNNFGFDLPVLRKEVARVGGTIPKPFAFVDSLIYFKRMYPERAGQVKTRTPYNLGILYQDLLGKELTNAHTADADVQGLYELLNDAVFRKEDLQERKALRNDRMLLTVRQLGPYRFRHLRSLLKEDQLETVGDLRKATTPPSLERTLRGFVQHENALREIMAQIFPSSPFPQIITSPLEVHALGLHSSHDIAMFYCFECEENPTQFMHTFQSVWDGRTRQAWIRKVQRMTRGKSH